MLNLVIPSTENYDERTGEFIQTQEQTLQMEHSLLSVSRWESKWHKAFLSESNNMTPEEWMDYIRCMTINKNVDDLIFQIAAEYYMDPIRQYIQDPMTATKVKPQEGAGRSRKIITSELIYSWMVSLEIPFECEKWHLNRLLTLIEVCNAENSPKKKMSTRDMGAQYRSLNAARRKHSGSRG